ncbi:MAG: hypothetical protein II707_06510, partial [Spirochaetales bacterium]|nr:hypothetical protein [Spirochaetales bacterium]
ARTNFVFNSWNTEANGTGIKYQNAESVKNLAEERGSITLYAIWETSSPSLGYICYESAGGKVYSSSKLPDKTPIGVVFEVGDKTKIVSLTRSYGKWSEAKRDAESLGVGWHMPDKGELDTIYRNRNVIETALRVLSDAQVFALSLYGGGWHWSSTTFSSDKAYAVNFSDSLSVELPYKNTNDYLSVRAVKSF